MCHLVSRRFLPFLLSLFALLTISHVAYCQTEPELDASAQSVRVQMTASKEDLTLTLLLAQPIDKATHAAARISLLNAQDVVRAQLDQNVAIRRGQTRLVVRLTKPFAAVPPQEMQDLQWLRVKYEVKSVDGIVLASGIEALLAPATDPFMLTAAASRVAFPGFPYRAQVHVKSHDGHPLAGVQITGSLVWDDETADEKKIDAKAISSSGGDATLEFSIPKEVDAESADLAIAAKNGLVARSFEKSVDFRARSYLLLDTDKDIYQPGQTLHVRALRFGPDRKALAKETLDLRIEDEDQTLVFKESFITDDYGVAHLDWPTPATLQQGSYSIHVGVGGEEDSWRNAHADKSIRIYRYDLPNFRVEVKPDKPYYLSGQNADLAVSAEYLFGKPVIHGKVRVVEEDNRHWNFRKQQWEAVEKRVETGDLDRDGHFTTHFDLSKNHADLKEEEEYKQFEDLDLAAYVTDLTTGRTEQRRFQLRVTRDPIHVYVSPGVFRNSKMPPSWFVSTFYADGTPARCRLRLIVSNDDDDSPQKLELQNAQTNKYGLAKIAELAIPKLGDSDQLIVEAKDAKGLTGRYTAEIYGDDSAWGTVEVATSHAILRSGDPIEVTVRSTRPNLRLMVQAIRDGVVLASQNVKLRNGRGAVTFPYDARFTDEIGIFAFSLEEEWDSEVMLESERTVLYPKNRQLAIDVHLDKDEHRPGEDASARFHLASSDKSAVEGALGIKVVDRAVEERARTDADFGQHSSGWWSWSLWSSGDSSFGGVTRQDLDQIDLSQPVPSDLDLVAEYILQSGFDDLEILEDQSPLSAGQAFSVFLQKQFERLDTGLRQWNEQGKWVRTFDDLQAVGKESGVDVKELRDPWGMPYRFALSFQGAVQIVTVTSAGPDKKFDTADDFQAHRTQHQFFFHYGKLIESATHDVMANEGRAD